MLFNRLKSYAYNQQRFGASAKSLRVQKEKERNHLMWMIKREYKSSNQVWQELHHLSVSPETREEFWANEARKLTWFKEWKSVLTMDENTPSSPGKWFIGGETNISYNCLDRHVLQNKIGDQVAIYYDSPVSGTKQAITYKELLDKVKLASNVLLKQGVKKGDRVIIYMPMIPEAVVAMLAVTRIGAIHSVVFGGFAARELAIRIDDAQPKMLITASHGIEPTHQVDYLPLIQYALQVSKHPPEKILFKQRAQQGTSSSPIPAGMLDWDAEMKTANADEAPFTPVSGDDTSYILYTSGTTGTPKGIVRDTGGYQTALNFCMSKVMQLKPKDVIFCTSDIGWVVGHTFIVYGPLLRGLSTVLYEGKPVGTPDAGAFWRVASEYKANLIYTAPTALRAIRKIDPNLEMISKFPGLKDSLRTLFLAGERADPETVSFFSRALKVPVIDCFWMTETGWPMISWHDTRVGIRPGSAGRSVPGFDVKVLDIETGKELPNGSERMGELCAKLPLPPGALTTVYNNPARFHAAYLNAFPGYYSTGDYARADADGYIHILSRKDDLINVAGHRLATTTIEQAISRHPDVAECACIAATDALKGELPVGFVVMKASVTTSPSELEKQIIQLVRQEVGPIASFKHCFVIDALPKTRSGKILRGVMKSMTNKQEFKVPATIEDPKVLDAVYKVIESRWH